MTVTDILVYHWNNAFHHEGPFTEQEAERRFKASIQSGRASALIRQGRVVAIYVGDGFRGQFEAGLQPHLQERADHIIYHQGDFHHEGPFTYQEARNRHAQLQGQGLATATIRHGHAVDVYVGDGFRPTFMGYVTQNSQDRSDFIIFHQGNFQHEGPLTPGESQRRFAHHQQQGSATALIRNGQLANVFVGDGFRPTFMGYVNQHLGGKTDRVIWHSGQFHDEVFTPQEAAAHHQHNVTSGQASVIIRNGQVVTVFVGDGFRPTFMGTVNNYLFHNPGRNYKLIYHQDPQGFHHEGPFDLQQATFRFGQLKNSNLAVAITHQGQVVNAHVGDGFRQHFLGYVNQHLY